MTRKFTLVLMLGVLTLSACDKVKGLANKVRGKSEPETPVAVAEPTPAVEATPTPTPPPAVPAAPMVDKSSSVISLCYHRFEEKPRDSLAISPKDFTAQMQALKDAGYTVISMQDFLAWRKEEKSI